MRRIITFVKKKFGFGKPKTPISESKPVGGSPQEQRRIKAEIAKRIRKEIRGPKKQS